MKKVILALILCSFAAPAFADKPAPPPHKKHKKVVVVPPPPAVVPPPVVVAPPPPAPEPPAVVVVPPPPAPPVALVPPVACPMCPPESKIFVPNLHVGIGVGAQAPWASGTIGFRLEFPVAYLALEPFMSLPYGAGVDGLVYAYRGKVVQFYPLAVGFMLNWSHKDSVGMFGQSDRYLSVQDVNRLIDLRVGAGLQIRLACHVKLAIDWRVNIPDPVKLAREDGICKECNTHGARALDAGNVVRNSFAQSQVTFGVLIQ